MLFYLLLFYNLRPRSFGFYWLMFLSKEPEVVQNKAVVLDHSPDQMLSIAWVLDNKK